MDCYLPECCKSLLKFTRIELSIAVEVHTLKDYLKSTDSDTAFLLNGELEFKVKLIVFSKNTLNFFYIPRDSSRETRTRGFSAIAFNSGLASLLNKKTTGMLT